MIRTVDHAANARNEPPVLQIRYSRARSGQPGVGVVDRSDRLVTHRRMAATRAALDFLGRS